MTGHATAAPDSPTQVGSPAQAGPPAGSGASAEPGTPAESGTPADPGPPAEAGPPAGAGRGRWLRSPATRRTMGHLLLIICFVGAGIGVTWPTAASLAAGRILMVPDVSSYVWALWWMAHQVMHVGDPWFTWYMAAPAGIELGFDTLMPLPGLIMTPVTLLWGPAASFSVLTLAVPGLLCYATYRAARLWLGQIGSIAAGALFGLSTMVTWQDLYHLNISIGTIFLPLTLEAAIRLKRRPRAGQGIILGVVLAASVLTNQESAVVAALLAVAILLPWFIRQVARKPSLSGAWPQRLTILALTAVVAIIVASPQLVAMINQVASGGATLAHNQVTELTASYGEYGVGLPTLFAPSPRLGHFFHLGLASAYQYAEPAEGVPTFGVILAGLGVLGLVLCWRRRQLRWLGLLWLLGAALALGPTLTIGTTTYVPLATHWQGVTVSSLMPDTWLIRIPGLSALREADRLALLGLLGAAILAGAAVEWLCRHSRAVVAIPIIVILAAGAYLEAGWSASGTPTMPTTMPRVDGPIAAAPGKSIVVDVPFGLRGGVGLTGFPNVPQALVLATSDGHPRAVSYTSWVPQPTINDINHIVFYRDLYSAQGGAKYPGKARIEARRSARRQDISWVIVWRLKVAVPGTTVISVRKTVTKYLYATGFHVVRRVNTAEVTVTVWHRRM